MAPSAPQGETAPAPAAAPGPPAAAPLPGAARRAAWVAASLVALALSIAGVLAQRRIGTLPAAVRDRLEEAPRSAFVVAAPGRATTVASSPAEVAFLAQREAPGARIRVDAEEVELVEELPLLPFLATLLSVVCYAAVTALALAPRAGRGGAGLLLSSLLLAMLAIGTGGVYPPRTPSGLLLLGVHLGASCAFPLLFLRTSLTFPRTAPFHARHPRALGPVYVVGAAIAAWAFHAWWGYLADPGAGGWGRLALPTHAIEAVQVLGMGLGCVSFARAGRRAGLEREKGQAKWLLWGIAVAATPFVFLRALPRLLLHVESPVTPAVDRLVELAAPLSITIAVVRHHLFDIDVIIRRSVIYTVLALLLVGVFLAASTAAIRFVPSDSLASRVLFGAAFAVPGALFAPTRRWLGRWVDRTLFRIRYDHDAALRALEPVVHRAPSRGDLARILDGFVRSTLEPVACGVRAAAGDGEPAVGDFDAETLRRADDALARHAGPRLAAPGATSRPDLETAGLLAGPASKDVRIVSALAHEGRRLGLLVLGPKGSGRRYVEDDLRLLDAAAALVGRALERLDHVERAAAEAIARRSLAALHHEKTEFLLRVAHDLRTPLTAVRWSAQNVADGLTGPVTAEQDRAVRAIDAAAGQLQRLVDNLLDVSRLELGAPAATAEEVDLPALTEDVVAGLRLLAEPKRVTVRRTSGAPLPPVRGQRGRLSQVVANLLDNAIKHSPPGGEVDVRTDVDEAGRVRLTVRDRGAGFPDGVRGRMFDLFAQGAPSPHGGARGFGIGLHVVKSWTEGMGGTVDAGNHPEGGAMITCRFPAATPHGAPA